MYRDEMISEISMRCDIPVDEVADVLEEEENIIEEELYCQKKKKHIKILCFFIAISMITAVVMCFMVKKNKLDLEKTMKKYIDKIEKIKKEYLVEK